ncbi:MULTISPECIES: polysaccharide biosynthesis/export family protein [unclassified Photobacterium]|uniref:polysaccharide biosynthesis/export family protein n=1 Tax=unclassified Photobacterium TaxID=2628852 RepID=UPI000D17DD73|nr:MULTISPECIES: polysaccharide biosynthesis/export family protein [unclassified Photobacterium]PSV26702.1 capsular biosynthesis protein [Photobacterium sp. GB-56]PSV31631.1 capsular biosynthesis protein [Photobacterium sp. GB-72]PSV37599.1 capsular biosynthesis protein [Photobacterium sp. GB-27]PSV45538.1 capsular biosynthesis protein [Photobacterium sp. GB-36]PSV53001.1 capsular biosynthesis protein [Photobacterium sp. GB-1]
MKNKLKAYLCLFLFAFVPHVYAAQIDTTHYQLSPGDKIQIKVYGEDNLSFDEILIPDSGQINYPYLGAITLKGRTLSQVKNEITQGLKGDYLLNPQVMVNLLNFKQIYVGGEVRRPGGYEYQPNLSVEKAVALAGGFTDRADTDDITIKDADNKLKTDDASVNMEIQPGDIIVVGQSFF